MNYLKQYKKLIRNAQKRGVGDELHHVFPRSLFGDNDFVVPLTTREHYVAHKLLFHICLKRYGKHPHTHKMCAAYHMMSGRTGRQYATARAYFVEHHHTKTEEGRRKNSLAKMGNQYTKGIKFGKYSTERAEKNRQGHNKTYELYFADGTTRLITGAKAFAQAHGYNHGHIIQVVKGNRKRHKDIIGGKKLD